MKRDCRGNIDTSHHCVYENDDVDVGEVIREYTGGGYYVIQGINKDIDYGQGQYKIEELSVEGKNVIRINTSGFNSVNNLRSSFVDNYIYLIPSDEEVVIKYYSKNTFNGIHGGEGRKVSFVAKIKNKKVVDIIEYNEEEWGYKEEYTEEDDIEVYYYETEIKYPEEDNKEYCIENVEMIINSYMR